MATKPKAKKQEVAVSKGNQVAVAAAVPDFMKQYAGQGTEHLDQQDVEIPRLQLLQSLSPQVQDGDHKAGHFYHTIAEEALGNELKIVPLFVTKRYLLWRPRHEGGGILARADDGKHWSPPNAEFKVKPYKDNSKQVTWKTKPTVQESGLANWGSTDVDDPNSQPAATAMLCVVAYLPDHPELSPCLITLQRGAITAAKKFMGKIKISGAPSFGQYFLMSGFKDNKGSGDFYNYSFERQGLVEDEEEFNYYKSLYDGFAATGIKIRDEEALQDEEQSGGGNAAKDGPIDI